VERRWIALYFTAMNRLRPDKPDLRLMQMVASHTTLNVQTSELLNAYSENPSISLRNKIVQRNVGLVRKIAHQVSHQCAEPYEDLEQIGYIGLIRAIERFDLKQGCAFSSFAVPYIRGEMLHFLRDRASTLKLPRRWQELQRKVGHMREELIRSLGRAPRDAELAEALGVSEVELHEVRLAGRNRSLLSLDATVSSQPDATMTLGDMLPDVDYQALQAYEEERQQLQGALSQLESKTRSVIEWVFLKGLSRKEVAARIGVSPMTVTRRMQRGIDELVGLLNPSNLQSDP